MPSSVTSPWSTPALLAQSSHATVAAINYRLDTDQNTFPTPIHDVLSGFDWIAANLARPHGTQVLGVHGVDIAGSGLALMLGLTEARLDDEVRVGAVSVRDPVCSWVLEEYDADVKDEGELRKLLRLRDDYFSTVESPGRYFDPFASPLLFLRTPGLNVPAPQYEGARTDVEALDEPPDEEAEQWAALIGLEDMEAGRQTVAAARVLGTGGKASGSGRELSEVVSDGDTTIVDAAIIDDATAGSAQRRKPSKRARRFPPPGTSLIIPRIQIRTTAGPGFQLVRRQAEEMVRLLRRSIMSQRFEGVNQTEMEKILRRARKKHGLESGLDELEDMVLMAQREAEDWITLEEAVFEEQHLVQEQTRAAGRWFADVLT